MLPDEDSFTGPLTPRDGVVHLGDDSSVPSIGVGTSTIGSSTLLVPALYRGLISTAQDDREGRFTVFGDGQAITISLPPIIPDGAEIIRRGTLSNEGMYELAAGARLGDESFSTLHAITHFSVKKLNHMIKNKIAYGLPHSTISAAGRIPCADCLEGKMRKPTVGQIQHRLATKKRARSNTKSCAKFEQIGFDVIDNGKSCGRRRYSLISLDYGTDKAFSSHFTRKSDFREKGLAPLLNMVAATATTDKPQPLKFLQSDSDQTYWTREATKMLPPGATLRLSAPYTQAQNGRIEEVIGTVRDNARVLMIAAERKSGEAVPRKYRPDALDYAIRLRNAGHTASDTTRSPDYRFDGSKADFSNWIPFWDKAWAHEPRQLRDETGWAPKGVRCRVLGPAPNYKDTQRVVLIRKNQLGRTVNRYKVTAERHLPAFRTRQTDTGTTHTAPPATSSPPSPPTQEDRPAAPAGQPAAPQALPRARPAPRSILRRHGAPHHHHGVRFMSPIKSIIQPRDIGKRQIKAPSRYSLAASADRTTEQRVPQKPIRSKATMAQRNKTFAQRVNLDSHHKDHDIESLARIARRHTAHETGRPIGWREARKHARACIAKAHNEVREETANLPPVPRNWDDAMAGDYANEWRAALTAEQEAMREHGTFRDAPNWKGRTVKSKLVYRVTREPDGAYKFKIRLVAQGFTEKYGVDYFETFAPTIATRSLHLLLHIAASEDRELRHIDVAGAYLESLVDTELYMRLPLDYTGGTHHVVVRLIKSIYGLKQSGELWNKLLDKHLQELGYSPSYSDPCVYYKHHQGKPSTYVCLYVDDILLVGHSGCTIEMDFFEAELSKRVTRIKSGPVKRFIGIDISRSRGARIITLTQTPFLAAMLKHENMADCCLKRNPGSALVNLQAAPKNEAPEIRPLVGKIRYAVDHTRPESLFIASQLSSAAGNPGIAHVTASKHLLRYFSGTLHQGVTLGGPGPIELEGWVDAALVDEGDSRSQLGYCWRLNKASGMTYSRSMRDKAVSLSSAEAELRAMAELVKDILWARGLLEELGFKQNGPTVCHEDNSAVIDLCATNKVNTRTKHLTKILNFVRSHIRSGRVAVLKVPGEDNVADILTKPLPAIPFLKHCSTLNGSHLLVSSIPYTPTITPSRISHNNTSDTTAVRGCV